MKVSDMKTDNNGCSTCPIGSEKYEKFTIRVGHRILTKWQYDYRHINGELFSTVKSSLEECREAKDRWLIGQ